MILACVFVLSHTGMDVYDANDAEGFYDRQARSTRDTPTSAFFDWLAGGLNSQIEHHMFPSLSRRRLAKMREATKAAMLECGYAYVTLGNREAMRAVLFALGEAAARFAFGVAEALRNERFSVVLDCSGASFKSQMKKADGSGARYAVIIGDDEAVAQQLTLKPLRGNGEQTRCAMAQAVNLIRGA